MDTILALSNSSIGLSSDLEEYFRRKKAREEHNLKWHSPEEVAKREVREKKLRAKRQEKQGSAQITDEGQKLGSITQMRLSLKKTADEQFPRTHYKSNPRMELPSVPPAAGRQVLPAPLCGLQ